MEESRRDRKKKEKQDAILRAAAKLFQQKGIASVSLEEIAEVVDISRGTIYNHFHSKDSLVKALLTPFIDKHLSLIKTVLELPTPIPLRKILELCVKMWENHHEILKIIDGGDLDRLPEIREKNQYFHRGFGEIFKRIDTTPLKFDSPELIGHIIFKTFQPMLTALEKVPQPYESFFNCMEDMLYKEGMKPKIS